MQSASFHMGLGFRGFSALLAALLDCGTYWGGTNTLHVVVQYKGLNRYHYFQSYCY